jgi:hypothetical protein
MEMMGIERESWGEVFADIRSMEAEARATWRARK